jgi:hypothetical protein
MARALNTAGALHGLSVADLLVRTQAMDLVYAV